MTDAPKTYDSLWSLTRGQRMRYTGTILAMSAASGLMFAAPLLARHALDVVLTHGFGAAAAWLVQPARWLGLSITRDAQVYLVASACASVLLTALAELCQLARARLSAQASESIARGLRDEL